MPLDSLIGAGLLGEDHLVEAPNGRTLRAMAAGSGDDLVVLEAGLGVSGLYWGPVHAALAKHVRVVAYERAGFGGSTPAMGETRDLTHLAADLAAVVSAFPHRRLMLVGHSWGGPIIRTYVTSRASADASLAGLVLADQSDEHAADLYASRAARWTGAIQDALLVPLARARLLAPMIRTQLVGLPPELLRATVAASATVDAARETVHENKHVAESLLRMQSDPPVLGDLPIRVLSGRKHGRLDRSIRERITAAHRQTAAAHPRAEFVPATRSAHMIPITEPELVAAQALALF